MQRNLTQEEWQIVRSFRELRKFEERQRIPAAFKKHGALPIAEAARLLRLDPAAMKEVTKRRLPVLPDGTIPRSELLREARRRNKEAIREKGFGVTQLVRPKTIPSRSFFFPDDLEGGYGVDKVAERLRTTKAHARSLITEGPLFAWRNRRGGIYVTQEELDAYAEAHPPPRESGAKPGKSPGRARLKRR